MIWYNGGPEDSSSLRATSSPCAEREQPSFRDFQVGTNILFAFPFISCFGPPFAPPFAPPCETFKLYIPQRAQWKQGVVIYMTLYTSLLYNTTPIHCTLDPLHPPLQSIHKPSFCASGRALAETFKSEKGRRVTAKNNQLIFYCLKKWSRPRRREKQQQNVSASRRATGELANIKHAKFSTNNQEINQMLKWCYRLGWNLFYPKIRHFTKRRATGELANIRHAVFQSAAIV